MYFERQIFKFAERVWRRPGERFARCCISPRTPFGGNSFYGRTELIFIEHGTLTADRYIGQCLETHVVPYAPFVGGNFLLMHDNGRPHTARIVTNYLDTVEIPRLEWPARSPDMNPVTKSWPVTALGSQGVFRGRGRGFGFLKNGRQAAIVLSWLLLVQLPGQVLRSYSSKVSKSKRFLIVKQILVYSVTAKLSTEQYLVVRYWFTRMR
jgi:hypothetical protein